MGGCFGFPLQTLFKINSPLHFSPNGVGILFFREQVSILQILRHLAIMADRSQFSRLYIGLLGFSCHLLPYRRSQLSGR